MTRLLPFLLLLVQTLSAQTDTTTATPLPDTGFFKIPTPVFPAEEKIAEARQLLRAAFLLSDDSTTNAWLDTLTLRLESRELAATYPEERWLLWYWIGRYDRIFGDLDSFNTETVWLQQQKTQPPNDSLIHVLDEISSVNQHALFGKIRTANLSAEEKAFAALHLEYLLSPRPTPAQVEDQDDKALLFLEKFPRSRFRPYMRDYLYSGHKTRNKGVELDFLLWMGRPDGRYGQNFGLQIGGSIGAGWRWGRWSVGGRLNIAGQKVRRDFELPPVTVVEDSVGFFLAGGPELGYTVFELEKIRLRLHAGADLALLSVPVPSPIEDDRDWRRYGGGQLMAGFSLDWRWSSLPTFDDEVLDAASAAQQAIRFFAGYQWCNFDRKNRRALDGNLFVVGLGLGIKGSQKVRIKN